MNAFAHQLERLSRRADHIDIDRAVELALIDAASPPRRPGRRRTGATVVLAVAASVVTVLGLVALVARDRETARGGPGTDTPSSPTAVPPLANESAGAAEPSALLPASDWAYSRSEVSPGVTRIEFIYTARPGDSDETQHGIFAIQFGDDAQRVPAEMLINTSLATVLGQPITLQSDETWTLHAGETELNNSRVYFTFEMVSVDVAAATLSELRQLDVPLDEWVLQRSASTIVVTETSVLP